MQVEVSVSKKAVRKTLIGLIVGVSIVLRASFASNERQARAAVLQDVRENEAQRLDNNINNNNNGSSHSLFHMDEANDDVVAFNGSSSIEHPTPGVSACSHVCMWGGRAKHWALFSHGKKLLRHEKRTWASWDVFKETREKPSEDWHVDNQKNRYILGETLMFWDLFGRDPAHCLNDNMFSIFSGQRCANISFSSCVHGTCPHGPFGFEAKCETWCCHAFHRSGIVPRHQTPVHPAHPGEPMVCLEKLVIPHFAKCRLNAAPQGVMTLHKRPLDNSNDGDNGKLVSELWKPPASEEDCCPEIFVCDRKGTGRRRCNDSQAFVDYLQTNYKANIHLFGPEWSLLTPAEQAKTHNSCPCIIAPHGAHLANLICAAPGTKVVEIHCQTQMPAPEQQRSKSAPESLTDHQSTLEA